MDTQPGDRLPVPTDALWALAESQGLSYQWTRLNGASGVLAVYTWDPVLHAGTVVLDDGLASSPRVLRSVLAEEMGHHACLGNRGRPHMHTHYSLRVATGRAEVRALRWAVDLLLPRPAFLVAMVEEGAQVPALADRFDVTEWLVQRAVEFRHDDLRAMWRLAGGH